MQVIRDGHLQPVIAFVVVLVCGGRNYGRMWDKTKSRWRPNWEAQTFLDTTLTELHARRGFTQLIHGNASGADTLADQWAHKIVIDIKAYPADWSKHGRSAGPIRNQQMLVEGRPTLVIAFKGDDGTKGMIDIARRACVEVLTPGWEY